MSRLLGNCSISALILLLTGTFASAQLSTARLSGQVTDQSGAVLPGVTVTVTQTNTGFTRSDVTDGDGSYVMPNLPTGPYRLEVSLSGFRTYTKPASSFRLPPLRSSTWSCRSVLSKSQ